MNKIILFTILFCGWHVNASDLSEFDLERFKASSFNCSIVDDCNYGTCSSNMCQCDWGYRDSVYEPCITKMAELNKRTPTLLEVSLGWVFPAGLVYLGLDWASAIRLYVEAVAIGFGVAAYRSTTFYDQVRYGMSSAIFSVAHIGGWILTVQGMWKFWKPNDAQLKDWHKNNNQTSDLTIPANKLNPHLIQREFDSDSCALVEKCIDGPGLRRLLTFDSYLYNIGKGDFVIGLEEISPEFSKCHQHYHGPDSTTYFLDFELSSNNGTNVINRRYGHKQGFCFIDSTRFSGTNDEKFNCGLPPITRQYTQGITAGHADLYPRTLDCQWIDITGVPAGTYYLKVTVNPLGTYYQDSDLTNNEGILEVVIPEPSTDEKSKLGIPVNHTVIRGTEV